MSREVAARTQNETFLALLFLYKQVLDSETTFDAVRAKKPERLRVVFSFPMVQRFKSLNAQPAGAAGFRFVVGFVLDLWLAIEMKSLADLLRVTSPLLRMDSTV